jgi:hypothetical protein
MTVNNASLTRLQYQGVPPQYPSQQSDGPQLLVIGLHTSTSGAQNVLEAFPVGEDAGHEGWEGSVGQISELVEECLQDRLQNASVDRAIAGEEHAQIQGDAFDLHYTIIQDKRDAKGAVVKVLAVEDEQRRTTRSWAVAIVLGVHAREAAAGCWGLVALL